VTGPEPTAAADAAVPAAAANAPQEVGLQHLGRRLLPVFLLGLLVVAGMLTAASPKRFLNELRHFDLRLLVPILLLSLVNYSLRFVRWEIYLEHLGSTLPRRKSLAIFVVGFLLTVTPGKAGEFGKAWLIRELGGGPALRFAPVILAERITDFTGVLILLSAGSLPLPYGPLWAAGFLLFGALLISLLTWGTAAEWFLGRLARLPLLGPRMSALADIDRGLRQLLSTRLLLLGVLISIVAWGAEGVGFVILARAYAPGASFLSSMFDYTAATTLGSATLLPGGLGAADAALTALVHSQGLDTSHATLVTFIIRGATLWFAVLLGLAALPWVARWLAQRGRPNATG
jgi:glycosyltransferase 2 family protein